MTEQIIKLTLLAILVLAGLSYWLLPKTQLARHFKMNETLFIITAIIGVICGVFGLIATAAWPQYISEWHLWVVICMPLALIYIYWAVIIKSGKTKNILDEKQEFDMGQAAAATFAFSIPLMVVLYTLYDDNILEGSIFFPYYLFMTLMFYSASTLFYFKKA